MTAAKRQKTVRRRAEASRRFSALARALAAVGRDFRARGLAIGTSGNLSAVVRRDPLRLAMTSSGVDKAGLSPRDILEVDERARPTHRSGRPSAEALLHVAVVRARGAGAVFHTHSVWGTILSAGVPEGECLLLEGYEMLKGLAGVRTHLHREQIPVFENSQDYDELGRRVEDALVRKSEAHGFLLRRHGLYTWGRDVAEAKRHAEILEFLFEVEGRARAKPRGDL